MIARRVFVLAVVLLVGVSLWALGAPEAKLHTVLQTGPTQPVTAVAFSPSGDQYALGDGAGLLLIYRSSDNMITHRFTTGGGNGISALAFSPDGKQLLIATWTTYLYDIASETILKTANHFPYTGAVVFGPGREPYGIITDYNDPNQGDLYALFQTKDEYYRPLREGVGKILVLASVSQNRLAIGTKTGLLQFLNTFGSTSYERHFGSAVVGFQELSDGYLVALSDGTIHRVRGTDDLTLQDGLGELEAASFNSDGTRFVAWNSRLVTGTVGGVSGFVDTPVLDEANLAWLKRDYIFPQVAIDSAGRVLSNRNNEPFNPLADPKTGLVLAMDRRFTVTGWETPQVVGPPLLMARQGNYQQKCYQLRLDQLRLEAAPVGTQVGWGYDLRIRSGTQTRATMEQFQWGNGVTPEKVSIFDCTPDRSTAIVGTDVSASERSFFLVKNERFGTPPRELSFVNREIASRRSKEHPQDMQTYYFSLSPDGKRAVTELWGQDDSLGGNLVVLFDLEKERVLGEYPGTVSCLVGAGQVLVNHYDLLSVVSLESGATLRSVSWDRLHATGFPQEDNGYRMMAVSPDGKIGAIESIHRVVLFRLSDFSVLHDVPLTASNETGMLQFSEDGTLLYRIDSEKLSFVRVATGEVVHLVGMGNDYVFYTDDGYFEGSREAGKILALGLASSTYGMDQLAAHLNRPDILMKRLGMDTVNPDLYAFFRANYLKRLARMGLTEEKVATITEMPDTKVKRLEAKGPMAEMDVLFSSPKQDLQRYTVYVNDVPLFGQEGKALRDKSALVTVTFDLIPGENKVEVSCFNVAGAESLRVLSKVQGPDPSTLPPPDLYYLGFGVSQYANPDLNLRYADKDALDLEKAFRNSGGSAYAHVLTKTFTNNQVDLTTMNAAKDFLAQARPQDTVILFIAGHGVFTRDSATPDYFYIAYNTDVSDIEHTAIRFSEVEELLQGLPARQKLFLMDTCNSGEVDPISYTRAAAEVAQGTQARAVRGISVVKLADTQKAAIPRTWLAEKGRYSQNDLIRRSGAIVFSSSKGGEYSYESEKLGNGMFTSAILKVLGGELEVAKDENGNIGVRALVDAVSAEVPKMTDELQHPGVDRDNLSVNFALPVEDPEAKLRIPLEVKFAHLPLKAGDRYLLRATSSAVNQDPVPVTVDAGGNLQAQIVWRPDAEMSLQLTGDDGQPVALARGLPSDTELGSQLPPPDPEQLSAGGNQVTIDASAQFATLQLNQGEVQGQAWPVKLTVKLGPDAAQVDLTVVGAPAWEHAQEYATGTVDDTGTLSLNLRLPADTTELSVGSAFTNYTTIPLPPAAIALLDRVKLNTVTWDATGKTPALTVNGKVVN